MINDPFAEDGIVSCQCCGSGEYLYNEELESTGRRTTINAGVKFRAKLRM